MKGYDVERAWWQSECDLLGRCELLTHSVYVCILWVRWHVLLKHRLLWITGCCVLSYIHAYSFVECRWQSATVQCTYGNRVFLQLLKGIYNVISWLLIVVMLLQEFPVLPESQIAVLKAVIGALHHDQVLEMLLFDTVFLYHQGIMYFLTKFVVIFNLMTRWHHNLTQANLYLVCCFVILKLY